MLVKKISNFILKFRYICVLRPKQILLHLSLKLIVMCFIHKLKQFHILIVEAVLGHRSDIFRLTLINKVQVVPGFRSRISCYCQFHRSVQSSVKWIKFISETTCKAP